MDAYVKPRLARSMWKDQWNRPQVHRLTRESHFIFRLRKSTDATANTRKLLYFQIGQRYGLQQLTRESYFIFSSGTHKSKNRKKKSKKQKNPKKSEKGKSKRKEEKNLSSVVLDKICVFCLYPIPDSQQYVKRGSCRRPILSGLLYSSSFIESLIYLVVN